MNILVYGAGAVGGYLGAHIALRIGNKWVRRVFAGVVAVVGVKLLLG